MKVKDIYDVTFSCACPCGSELSVGDFSDGEFTFTIMDAKTKLWSEVIVDSKDVKKIIKLLNKYEGNI